MPFDAKAFATRTPFPSGLIDDDGFLMELGPPPPRPTRWRGLVNKARRVSYATRVWIATRVLRLDLGNDD